MPKLKELIGTVVKRSEQVLHHEFIDRFSKAILNSGQASLSYASLASLGDFESVLQALHLNAKNILHSRESFTVFEDPPLEKVLTIETKIKDLYEQQAGEKPIAFVVIQITGQHNKKPLFSCERIWAISGGFPRGNT